MAISCKVNDAESKNFHFGLNTRQEDIIALDDIEGQMRT